jgi:hypothetical protein
MAPARKNIRRSNVKQPAKAINTTTYSKKLRSANAVTPSKDDNKNEKGNFMPAEKFEITSGKVCIL